MGFYIEMQRLPSGGEYREIAIPKVYWILYAFAGFALGCMGGAAYALLGDLARAGGTFDRGLIAVILLFIPLYLSVGVKMALFRRFVAFDAEEVRIGFKIAGYRWVIHRLSRSEIQSVELVNEKRTQNFAPREHKDKMYYVQGHWRVLLVLKDGRRIVADKHTEKGELEPLFKDLQGLKA